MRPMATACAIGAVVTVTYAWLARPDWVDGKTQLPSATAMRVAPAGKRVLRIHDVGDLVPASTRRTSEPEHGQSARSNSGKPPRWFSQEDNITAFELSTTLDFLDDGIENKGSVYCFGGRMAVVGTDEYQRRVWAVLRLMRRIDANNDDIWRNGN